MRRFSSRVASDPWHRCSRGWRVARAAGRRRAGAEAPRWPLTGKIREPLACARRPAEQSPLEPHDSRHRVGVAACRDGSRSAARAAFRDGASPHSAPRSHGIPWQRACRRRGVRADPREARSTRARARRPRRSRDRGATGWRASSIAVPEPERSTNITNVARTTSGPRFPPLRTGCARASRTRRSVASPSWIAVARTSAP